MAKAAQQIKTNETATEVKPNEVKLEEAVAAIPFDYQKLLEEHKSKSAVIRFLLSKNYKRGPIAKFMGIKYQFVRNVDITPVKKTAA